MFIPQKLIVGLGNPGLRYANTPHNAGFRVVDRLAAEAATMHDPESHSDYSQMLIGDIPVLLVKPMTYMNSSGEAVAVLINRHALMPNNLLVVHDSLSIPLGRLRFQHTGSAGGHNGVKNIIEKLEGEQGFDRLKVAVGPDPGGASRLEYVLAPFASEVSELYEQVIQASAEAVKTWVTSGIEPAMNRHNGIDFRRQVEKGKV